MAEKKNALKSVVVWLHNILEVVAQRLQDVEAKKEILAALGLNATGANASPNLPAGSLASIRAYVDKSDDDIDIEAFLSVVADIISVSNAIDDFIHVVTATEDPEIVNETMDMLLQLYLMEAVRLRSTTKDGKAFYLVHKTLNFYQELADPSGGVYNFTRNIARFIKRIFESFNAEDDDEAELVSDSVCILLAGLSYFLTFIRDNLKVVYGYDPSPDSTSPVADKISERTISLSLSYKVEDPEGTEITATMIVAAALRPQNQQGGGFEVLLSGSGKLERKFGDWNFSFAMEGTEDTDLRAKIKIEHDGEQSPLVIGDTQGTNLTIGNASFQITASIVDNDLDFKLNTKESAFVLAKGKTDGFLNSILPEKGIYGSFDFGIGYSLRKSVYVDGGSSLTVFVPLHTTLGPLVLNAFYLKLAGNENRDGVLLETSIGLTTKFLGLAASVERIGLLHNLSLPADGNKNLGFINYDIRFKPPNGVGLSVDSGVVKGGGFLSFDEDKGEYTGALELDFKDLFSLKAVGIINTKMPDGSSGFSLLIIITADFTPIQLGFGFVLIGVGGLLGLNRTTRIDVLREGIKTNALNSILFPEDVVANISRIVSDIKQVFPPQMDRFIIGPMAKIGWGNPAIITLELGLLLEIPVPRIAILGVLRALLPDEKSELLKLQINFLGIIDFENKYISFDASLYDSRLLAFTLTGDMAFRLSWGDNPLFILSVGGFHPAFKDAPSDLQHMTRLTISLLSGENPRITIQCYFAVTSNTVQFGAKAELYAEAAGFNVYGFIGFDVLFQFDPFHFIAELSAGLALRNGTSVLMGIRLSGELSGPTPWDVRGEASFSILFFDITVSFHETWGDRPEEVEAEKVDLLALLSGEVTDVRNWKADIPDTNNLHVTIKQIDQPADKLIVHPFGVLTFSERLLPLQVPIAKFGNKVPQNTNQFELTDVQSNTTTLATEGVKEQFAPANFFELSDDQKLSNPSFELLPSGFKISAISALRVATPVSKSVDYELTYFRKKKFSLSFAGIYKLAKDLFKTATRSSAVTKASLSKQNNRISRNAPEAVAIKPVQYGIANVSDLQLHSPELVADSYTEASLMFEKLVAEKPELKDQLQILSTYELG